MKEQEIVVGLKTSGAPVFFKDGEETVVSNLLIGDRFHWEKTIEARFPGEVMAFSGGRENVTLLNRVPLETYLECVVGSEMNPSSPPEFLKAHAVISRSWALGKILGLHHSGDEGKVNHPYCLIGWDDTAVHTGYDVCSDDHCQRYQGIQPISKEGRDAIKTTTGEILADPFGNLVDARFSKCCGGQTEIFSTCWQKADVTCLQSFPDPWCDLSGYSELYRKEVLKSVLKDYDLPTDGYGYRWEVDIKKSYIGQNIRNKFGKDVGEVERIEPLHRGPSGRIDLLRIHGSESTLDLGKELWIRRLLSHDHLFSSAFEIDEKVSFLRLSGRGWGHGVGLCQIGAANMALLGASYKDILEFYYPFSRIVKVRDGLHV